MVGQSTAILFITTRKNSTLHNTLLSLLLDRVGLLFHGLFGNIRMISSHLLINLIGVHNVLDVSEHNADAGIFFVTTDSIKYSDANADTSG